MKKKLLVIFTLLVLVTSACSGQTSAETATPTVTETRAVTATATESPPTATETLSVEASATPETPAPTNPPDCTNRATFVDDVTIPDNTSLASSTAFTKTWRIRNTGTCVWGPDYALIHYSEERMLAPASVPLSVTFPDQTVDLSIELTSPNTAGTHRGYFVVETPAGLIMKIDSDSRLWVVINVSGPPAVDATATPVSGNIPPTSTSSGGGLASAACAVTTDATKVTETIQALNSYRAQIGLPAFTVNAQLNNAATVHANDIACNKLFSHNGSSGSTPATRVTASGYSASSVTENVQGSYPPLSGQEVVDWWKNDKTDIRHNQNLLSSIYTEIGVAYSFYNNYGYYVLVFAKP